ncbi:MAG: hypothetical protein HFH84_19660 [Lachnospiraceae bacterium]|nr:hypothetical protein [Lachnospiraceae bacterium]
MEHKGTFKKTLTNFTLALSILPVLGGNLPPVPIPNTTTPESTVEEETNPEIQPLNDKDPRETKKE